MRRRLLAGAALALLAWPATGHAQSGGATVPGPTGGAGYGASVPGLIATRFAVTPRTLAPGAALTFRYRIDGTRRSARVRVDVLPLGSRHPAARIRLGWKRTGRTMVRRWTPIAGVLTPGEYVVRLHAVDRSGRTLRRTATASGRSRLIVETPPAPTPPAATPPAAVGRGAFPVRGAYSFGDLFGAERDGAKHRGQDLPAAEGTPVASPRAATVTWRAYQAAGAGNYVVVHADDGRDFVFMHLQTGSITVEKGATLAAGQLFAKVGSTGHSTGPHLHFEIWPDGWYASDASQPIDPLPDLQGWAQGV
jgi:murein DD-endopeptidase MepM/ murein hydrolase activator NlpD